MLYDTINQLVTAQSELYKDKTFIVEPNKNRKISFIELKKTIDKIQLFLNNTGANYQDRIALFMENGIGYSTAFLATAGNGQIAIPVNLAYKAKELKYVIDDADVRFFLTTKKAYEEHKNIIDEIFSYELYSLNINELILLKKIGDVGGSKTDKELAMILYTSGTTGNPKGVMLTHKNLLTEAANIKEAHQFSDKDIALCVLPLFHINGLVITLITPLLSGMKLIMPPKFSASNFWKWVSDYKVTWISAVPTIYSILLSNTFNSKLDYSSLRFARSASAPLPKSVLEEFEKLYNIPIIESFGISEGASQITSNPLPPRKTKLGSVGIAFGNRVEIADENGNILAPNNVGEIIIKGENIAVGYWNKLNETKSAFKDGWFHTGDLGYLDDEGYLYINGRKKELINRAGEKFSPREIDEVLYQIPEVELAASVGVPDPIYNEEVIAYIKLKDNSHIDAEKIKNYCKERLSAFKIPKEIYFTDDFPKGPSGKIQRLKFVDRYLKLKGSI